ncbi:hypothetical protein AciPR4_3386 [Terriglobus saanensis SP1PR4]|uniref:DUF4440 domain-containing protein n=2 Tax=Terriglobus saanensis TaxID=870903 RepID=E8UXB6_TERSS|nr:hypothetical protein AciPR4_3386 [Terriglobus saanensis SP1PR4]
MAFSGRTSIKWLKTNVYRHSVAFARFSSFCVLMALLPTTPLRASSTSDLSSEEKAVLNPLQSIMDGLAQGNHELIRAQLFPGGMATLIRGGKPLQLSWDAFVDRLPKAGTTKYEEVLSHPVIYIDHDIAAIWVPYTFTVDGKIHHCGTDIATLFKQDGHWLITGIADNSRADCSDK